MLIRIAPDMFKDSNFGCVTIRNIREEVFRTQKFKGKYDWRLQYKNEIRNISDDAIDKKNFRIVDRIAEEQLNPQTGRPYNLSYIDKNVVACALTKGYQIGTGDSDLMEFARNEFEIKSLSSLEILNSWIDKSLIMWSTELHNILKEWDLQNEKPQPAKAIHEFSKLTGEKYPGP